ncbi:hypothetical protein YH65_02690 [Sulfurovum lithotrophicum]|uniref:Uncharacterized protein n=1 Tax=Sulfurovum lithotrophicum TaxID=206403 RepID=A0A7U4RQ33_9BACT|nr:hypothetical protein [Sulfurovum lithotrophicum]AKF24420.1 hypothetical protein YH65_02690 [Sulfurovum lithotrophicum]
MADKKKDSKNMLFVSIFIGTMLIFMVGTVIYVTSQVANCSSAKKAQKLCYQSKKIDVDEKKIVLMKRNRLHGNLLV